MSDTVRAEKIACEVDHAARQLAQAGRLDLTREQVCPLPSAWAASVFRSTAPRCCAEPCYTITFSTIGTTPTQAIDCTDSGIHFLLWRVPRKILS